MALPNVTIELLNNQLGRQDATDDGVCLLVLSGVATSGIGLLDPKQIFTPEDAEALGLNAAYDTTNSVDVYRQITEFYSTAGRGAELWIMLYVNTMLMATACDVANNYVRKGLDAAKGRIRLVAIGRVPIGSYTPTTVDGMDDDVRAAVLKLHAMSVEYRAAFKPFRFIVAGRLFQGVPATLPDLRLLTQNTGAIVLHTTLAGGKNPAIGQVLGKLSFNPVQRKISRVKDGDLGILLAYMSDGLPVETYESAWGSIHDKGYIFCRKFANRSGYFLNGDHTCSPNSDDYSSLARGRVIDKALVIAYTTFVNEIEDDLEVDEDGYMNPAVVKHYQSIIENSISLQMMDEGKGKEISGVKCTINPAQNLLGTDKVQVEKLAVRPKGYSTYINVPLGFTNPLNQS
jgi:hypothetical protein